MKLAVVSNIEQYNALKDAFNIDSYIKIACDNLAIYDFLSKDKIAFDIMGEELLQGQWSEINKWACEKALPRFSDKDPKQIVIDEVAGQGLALLFCGPTALNIALGFALFRLFDIWKPWPIRVIDDKLSGSAGIMLDDLVAGIFAAICLMIVGNIG